MGVFARIIVIRVAVSTDPSFTGAAATPDSLTAHTPEAQLLSFPHIEQHPGISPAQHTATPRTISFFIVFLLLINYRTLLTPDIK
jgi:hypothetical protein